MKVEYTKALFGILLITATLFYSSNINAQNWTEPVNVSNMGGFNQYPDFTFDHNGTLHCVWMHVFQSDFSKIYYSKSFDEGDSWTTPEDISMNDEKRLSQPHIVSDSENNLYVTYDYNTYNPYQTLIYLKIFDGTSWSEPVIVSTKQICLNLMPMNW